MPDLIEPKPDIDALAAVKDILIKGVTVWDKPEEIGRVSIYDNF